MRSKKDIQMSMENVFRHIQSDDNFSLNFYDNQTLSLQEKNEILLYFEKHFPEYKFTLSSQNEEIICEKIEKEENI